VSFLALANLLARLGPQAQGLAGQAGGLAGRAAASGPAQAAAGRASQAFGTLPEGVQQGMQGAGNMALGSAWPIAAGYAGDQVANPIADALTPDDSMAEMLLRLGLNPANTIGFGLAGRAARGLPKPGALQGQVQGTSMPLGNVGGIDIGMQGSRVPQLAQAGDQGLEGLRGILQTLARLEDTSTSRLQTGFGQVGDAAGKGLGAMRDKLPKERKISSSPVSVPVSRAKKSERSKS
jgi:hypothetical protein